MNTYIILNATWSKYPAVILTDYMYWAEHENELREWCKNNLSKGISAFTGSVVEFTNDKELVLFTLRWS